MAQIRHYVQVPPLLVAPYLLTMPPQLVTTISVSGKVVKIICFQKRATCAFLILVILNIVANPELKVLKKFIKAILITCVLSCTSFLHDEN